MPGSFFAGTGIAAIVPSQPFYIDLNVAVGGIFPGSPVAGTAFPMAMGVDWIRIYTGEP